MEELSQNKKGNLVRLDITIDEDLAKQLRQIAFAYNVTRSDVVRYALRKTLPELAMRLNTENRGLKQ